MAKSPIFVDTHAIPNSWLGLGLGLSPSPSGVNFPPFRYGQHMTRT